MDHGHRDTDGAGGPGGRVHRWTVSWRLLPVQKGSGHLPRQGEGDTSGTPCRREAPSCGGVGTCESLVLPCLGRTLVPTAATENFVMADDRLESRCADLGA